jgi:hypothetical protein
MSVLNGGAHRLSISNGMYAFTRSDDEPDIEALPTRYRQMPDDMVKRNLDAALFLMRKSDRETWRVQAEIAEQEVERRTIQAE